jgi:hypothetical protein
VESYTLGDPQAGPGDTEEMSRERVEAYLRLLAGEVRRPAWPRRVRWAAELLIGMQRLPGRASNKGRWPPLTTVSTEPGLQAGSHDLP